MDILTATLPDPTRPRDVSEDRQFANNLARGLEVLRAFTPDDHALGNRDLCQRTGLPKATVSRLTHTLTLLGYLSRSPDQRYTLGSGVLSLGYPLLASMPIRQIARPWLERLARQTGCTVNLGMIDRLRCVYVDSIAADRGNSYRPDIGSTLPLLVTSIGRALVLGRPAGEQTAILNRLKVADPQRYRLDRPLFDRDRDTFRTRGHCTSEGQWRPEVHAVAVPLNQTLEPQAVAINCTLWASRYDDSRLLDEVAPAMLDTARRIEVACRRDDPLHDRSHAR
jgi:DNA-binding IclR family transcriptional regulator